MGLSTELILPVRLICAIPGLSRQRQETIRPRRQQQTINPLGLLLLPREISTLANTRIWSLRTVAATGGNVEKSPNSPSTRRMWSRTTRRISCSESLNFS